MRARLPGPPAFLAYRAGAAVARRLPPGSLPRVERIAGRAAARMMTGRRAQVERNVARIYGPELTQRVRDAIVRETFSSYARYWLESFRLPDTPVDALAAGVTSTGLESVSDALAAGTGAILAVPHLGGWEWGAFWLAEVNGWPITAVVEPIEPPELAEWFLELRAKLGMEIVPLGPGAGAACAKALKENRVLCLVCDRDLAGDGIPVPFLGEVTTLPAGPATLSLRSGAPLHTAATFFEGRGHRFVIDPPLDTTRHAKLREDVARLTAEVAARFEKHIRTAPEQWHLLQPNWPSDRD